MEYDEKDYQIDREELQSLVGATLDRSAEVSAILSVIRGKEVKAQINDSQFQKLRVRAIISDSALPGSFNLWLQDWQGNRLPQPWAIKILEVYS